LRAHEQTLIQLLPSFGRKPRLRKIAVTEAFVRRETVKPYAIARGIPRINLQNTGRASIHTETAQRARISRPFRPHKPPTLSTAPPTPAHQTRTRSTRQLTSMVTSQSTLPRPPRGGAPASMYVAPAAPRRSHSRARRRPPSHRRPRTLATAAPPSLHAGAKDGPTEPRANRRRRGWLAHRAASPLRRIEARRAAHWRLGFGAAAGAARRAGGGGDAVKGRCGSGGGFSRGGSTATGAQQRGQGTGENQVKPASAAQILFLLFTFFSFPSSPSRCPVGPAAGREGAGSSGLDGRVPAAPAGGLGAVR
jgi:hypothetical protein